MITISNRDLFESKADAIINTVNCIGVMGKGIALEFKRRYPEMFERYKNACSEKKVQVGRMWVFSPANTLGLLNPRLIINFPTKIDWRDDSRLEYIADGLQDLIYVLAKYKVDSVAIPALGCTNGGLSWKKVRPLIEDRLYPISDRVDITVYEPRG